MVRRRRRGPRARYPGINDESGEVAVRDTPCKPTKAGKVAVIIHSYCVALRGRGASRVPDKQATKASKQNAAALCAASVWHERQQAGAWSATGQCSMGSAAGAAIRMLAAHSDRRVDPSA